jgi:hypothetical protein
VKFRPFGAVKPENFYFKSSGKSLQSFKQESAIIIFVSEKTILVLCEKRTQKAGCCSSCEGGR